MFNLRPEGARVARIRRTTEATFVFDAPYVSQALAAIEDGRRPSDRELRGAIRELRRALAVLDRRSPPELNLSSRQQLTDWIDVLRFAQRQPVEQTNRTCTGCGRRPPRFGDLCGRCAEAAGTRPKGKA